MTVKSFPRLKNILLLIPKPLKMMENYATSKLDHPHPNPKNTGASTHLFELAIPRSLLQGSSFKTPQNKRQPKFISLQLMRSPSC